MKLTWYLFKVNDLFRWCVNVLEKRYSVNFQTSLHFQEAEEYLSDLVTSKTVFAKIDRPDGIVVFRPPKDANDTLNSWSHDVSELMSLLNKTTHLITKEQMVHQLLNWSVFTKCSFFRTVSLFAQDSLIVFVAFASTKRKNELNFGSELRNLKFSVC